VIPGEEVSLREGHELVWGVGRAGLDRVNALSDSIRTAALDSLVRADGGFAATAHPRGGRKPWTGAFPAGASALEIVNGDVEWRDDSVEELVRALLFYPFDRQAAFASLMDAPRPALAWWDSLLATRVVFGLAGLDAHGGVRSGRWTLGFPPYAAVMGFAHQCAWIHGTLPRDPALAEREILDALRAGHHFAALEGFGSAKGFALWAESGGSTAISGDSIALLPGATIHARVPRDPRVTVRLIRAGSIVDESRAWEAEFDITAPGLYRVEVYQRRNDPFGHSLEIPWIYSNPIVFTAP